MRFKLPQVWLHLRVREVYLKHFLGGRRIRVRSPETSFAKSRDAMLKAAHDPPGSLAALPAQQVKYRF